MNLIQEQVYTFLEKIVVTLIRKYRDPICWLYGTTTIISNRYVCICTYMYVFQIDPKKITKLRKIIFLIKLITAFCITVFFP